MGGENPRDTLRLSRAETTTYGHIRDELGSATRPAALGWRFGTDTATAAVLAHTALFETPPPAHWQADIARGTKAVCPVSAADLMPALQGPALGQKLREIEARWLASDLYLSKAEALS